MRANQAGAAFVLLFIACSFLLSAGNNIDTQNTGQTCSPSPAANVASNNTFPATNAQLYTGSSYNFTSNARDDASLNRNWDSANLVVQQSDQVAYSNTSLTPLGTYNATYSFTSDRAGGLASSFAYTDTTKFSVVSTYLGHQQLHRGTTAAAAWQTASVDFATGQTVFSYWICAASGTYNAVRLYRASDNAIMQIAYLDAATTVYTISSGVGTTNLAGFAANRWYFVAVVINFVAKTYQFYVDGVLRANGLAIYTVAGTMEVTRLSQMVYNPADAYIDGVQIGGNTTNAVDLGQVGVYNATASFEDNVLFANTPTSPLGTWADGSGASCYAKVVPAVFTQSSYHHNILCLDDQNAGTSAQIQYSYPSNQLAGTVEYWFLSTNIALTTHCQFYGWNAAHATNPWNIYVVAGVLYAAGTGAVTLMSGLASNTWYHVRIAFDTVADTFSVWVNGLLKTSNQAATAVTEVAQIYCNTGAVANTAFQIYLDGFDVSCDPAYYKERSTYMFLNSTSTFPVAGTMLSFPTAGSFSYKFQCWASGIAYDQGPVPFTVVNQTYPPLAGINYASSLGLLYTDVEVFASRGTETYLARYDLALNLTSSYANDTQAYMVELDNITTIRVFKGSAVHELDGTYYNSIGTNQFFADPVIAIPGVTVHVLMRSYYPIYSGTLNFRAYPLGNETGAATFAIAGTQLYTLSQSWRIHANILGDLNPDVSIGVYTMQPISREFTSVDGKMDAIGPGFYYAISAGSVDTDFFSIEEFTLAGYNPAYWIPTVGPVIENRLFTVNLTAAGTIVDPGRFTIGVQLHNDAGAGTVQTLLWNQSSNQFILPIPVLGTIYLQNAFQLLIYNDGELISNTAQNLLDPAINITLPDSYAIHGVFFSAFSNDGLGIPAETVRLYVNGTRVPWGLVQLTGAWQSIVVIDYVGTVQYSAVLDMSLYSEFNVFVNMATMILNNQLRNESITLGIYKSGILLLRMEIGQGDALSFRFTTGTYRVSCLYQNGTLEWQTIVLTTNSTQLHSFGVFIDPNVTAHVVTDMTGVIYSNILVCIIVFGMLLGWTLLSRAKDPLQEQVKKAKLPKKLYRGKTPPQLQNETTPTVGKRHNG
jgi:hypothetical protein